MTLVDTSAGSSSCERPAVRRTGAVRQLLDDDQPTHMTDVVVMEVLAGARDDDHRDRLRRLLARCEHVPVQGLDDFEVAANLYRACREARRCERSPPVRGGAARRA